MTPDRVDDFAKLLALHPEEKTYLNRWVEAEPPSKSRGQVSRSFRSTGQNHLLNDWLNVYVKDVSRLKGFKADPEVIYRLLGGMAPLRRIDRSLGFLLNQGFLRRTLKGKVVENTAVVTTTDEIPSEKIRKFHSQALRVAAASLATHPVECRQVSTLVLPLNEKSFLELKQKMKEFYESLLNFAEEHASDDERLYQVMVHLLPIGGIR